ncbi:MAG: GerMN domain-containing protein [Spirochaetes bacterium]|nr:GerMN domain-containing protein [Spirochaetota bacterium]
MAKKRYNRSGILFIMIILVLLGLILYAYKDKLQVFFNTNYNQSKDYLAKKFKFNDKKQNDGINIIEKIDILEKKANKNNSTVKVLPKEDQKFEKTLTENNKTIKDETKKVISGNEKAKNEKNRENEKINNQVKKIFFSKLNSNDNLEMISVNRTVYYTNMPLTETLKLLLSGPTASEKSGGIITNIPETSGLISVSIRNNIAYVNLTKEFEYNSYGKESTIAQIKQLVFTATEFPNIRSVQILIEGKVKTYLGGEGVIISKPISRNDFN